MKWIDIKKQKPLEQQKVLITGPFKVHTNDVAAAYFIKNHDQILWYEVGADPDGDWIAYENEVRYWMPFPELPGNEIEKEQYSRSVSE